MCIIPKTRLFVEKKKGFQVEAESLKNELNNNLHLQIKKLRLINLYDVFNIDEKLLKDAMTSIFSEPVTDDILLEIPQSPVQFAIEFLPGQFDQRADSAMQCLKLIDPKSEAIIKSAKLILLDESVAEEDLKRIKKYCP